MKQDPYEMAKRYGAARRATPLLSQFALSVAKAANRRLVKPSDASGLYETYVVAAGIAGQQSKKSFMVQTSKLRKVIEAGSLPGGPEMLQAVLDIYGEHNRHEGSAYEGMVDIARKSARQRKVFPRRTLQQMLEQ
jgi:hypothetical protein